MRAVKERAYAKINLYLNVTGKRSDGFHDIETVMHTVGVYDDITVTEKSLGKRGVVLLIDGNKKIPSDSKNIAYLAACLFLDRTLTDAEVEIRLTKRIPVAAGLAGGSADAAAVLRAMNRLFDRPLSQKALLSLAAELGSDVPYCLLGGTALCRGRGELIERLESVKGHFVVAVGAEHISTPAAYGELDRIYADFDGSAEIPGVDKLDITLSSVKEGKISPDGAFNIFEGAVLPACQGARAIKARMESLGASVAMMSGSGPSVFGVFADESTALAAAETLVSEGYTAFAADSV